MSITPKVTGKVYIQVGDGSIEPIAQFEGVGKDQLTTALVAVVREHSTPGGVPVLMNLDRFTEPRRGRPGRAVRVLGFDPARAISQPTNLPRENDEFSSLAELASFIGVAPAQLHNALHSASTRGELSACVRGVLFCYSDAQQSWEKLQQ